MDHLRLPRLSPLSIGLLAAFALLTPRVARSWLPVERALLTDSTAGGFGAAAALEGRFVALGAPFDDDAGGSWTCDSGSVLVFERDSGGLDHWGFSSELHAAIPACGDEFGTSVAISGDTMLVGARGRSNFQGAAYIFRRSGPSTWTQQALLEGSLSSGSDHCGLAVAISGDVAALGCPDEWVEAHSAYTGVVYLFGRNQGGPDAWGILKRVEPASDDFDEFGAAVALSQSTLLVGAPWSFSLDGRASVYEANQGGANNWGLVTHVVPSDLGTNEYFGASVDLDGTNAVIGAPAKEVGGDEPGAAYLFHSNAGIWSQVARLLADPPDDLSDAGISVTLAGGAILAGAPRYDLGGTSTGAALLFDSSSPLTEPGPPLTWLSNGEFVSASTEALDRFGQALAATPCHLAVTTLLGASSANDIAGVGYVFDLGIYCDDFESGSTNRWD